MLEYFSVFIFGTIIGSFLNVIIYRVPKKESILFPGSHCRNCNKKIKPYDNIPIISYLILLGKCRNCNTKISIRYPAVEALTGIIYLILFIKFGFSIDLAVYIVLASSLIAITFIDFDHKLIPNVITLPLIVFFIIVSLIRYLLSNNLNFLISSLSGMLTGGGILYLIAWISRGGMGGGDIKLAALTGTVLGWEKNLLLLFCGFVIGGIIGIILILTGKKDRKDMIPFGPFLCLGGLISILWGNEIIHWYLYSFSY